MYFNAETQARILRHFHFALRDNGVLMLGKSEMMISHRDLFAAGDLKKRIFVKQPRATRRRARERVRRRRGARHGDDDRASRDAALELGPHAHVIVSRTGRLTFANLPARALFGIVARRPRPAVRRSPARPPARSSWSRPIEQALRERRRVPVGEAAFAPERGDAAPPGRQRHAAAVAPTTRRSARASRSRTSRATRRCRPSWRATGATSSSPTRSCSRRSTSSRRPTRSSSPPTRSCRRPTRSSSRPTRSSRR